MMPFTSSLLLKRICTRISLSIRYRRYLISSNVCSGALVFALLMPPPASSPRSLGGLIELPIIAAASERSQIAAANVHFQYMEAILSGRHILRVVGDQVLSSQLPQNILEGAVQLRRQARRKHSAT